MVRLLLFFLSHQVGADGAEALDQKLGLGKAEKHRTAWYAGLRETADGAKHCGRLELITWEGKSSGQCYGFACKAVGPPADRERKRFERDFQPKKPSNKMAAASSPSESGKASGKVSGKASGGRSKKSGDGEGAHVDETGSHLLRYFEQMKRESPITGTQAFRWTCCGQSFSSGLNGCDHHRLGCMCDFCGAGITFGPGPATEATGGCPEPGDIFSAGLPRQRWGEKGHPGSVTPQGIANWKNREKFYKMQSPSFHAAAEFTEKLVQASARM